MFSLFAYCEMNKKKVNYVMVEFSEADPFHLASGQNDWNLLAQCCTDSGIIEPETLLDARNLNAELITVIEREQLDFGLQIISIMILII